MPDVPMQPPTAPKGQDYGTQGQQLASQEAQPLPTSPVASAGRPRVKSGGAGVSGGPAGIMPGDIPGLTDPSALPNEPITAGLGIGPGAGREALSTPAFAPEELSILRGVMLKYPNEDLRRQLEWTERNLA